MSLISREAILKDLRHNEELADHFAATADFVCGYLSAISDFSAQVENAPAVDAEVVRHGRWISENIRKKSYLRQCSVCNKIAYFCGTGCSYNYCPNCGAKMDGEHNDIQRV